MHPILFKIGPLPIHSYGLMLALSFLLGIWISSVRARRRNLDPNVVSDMGFWIILSAIIGARLYYVFLHFEEFKGNLTSIFNPFHGGTLGIGGLVMYGGFIGAIVGGFLFFKIKKLPFLAYIDTIAPSLGFGIFMTRIGCFLNGCCFGGPHDGACAVSFPASSPAGQYQISMHADSLFASQLFASGAGLFIAILVLWAGRKKFFDGFEFYLTGILYAISRFSIDFTRYYSPDEQIAGLSHNQIVCIGLFVVFGGMLLKGFLFDSNKQQESVSQESANSSGEKTESLTQITGANN
ncbi:MAG: prolipoprotein diacylglyceryl transferase [Chitinispirillaceae bacterium]